MKRPFQLSAFAQGWGIWLFSLALAGFAFSLKGWQNQLEQAQARTLKEYRVDLELSKNKAEYMNHYRAILSQFKLPQGETFSQNAWVQFAQKLSTSQNLSLKELKPVYETGQKGKGSGGIYLALEGSVADLFQMFYQIAEAGDLAYAEKFSLSQLPDSPDRVRAQLTLAQVKRS